MQDSIQPVINKLSDIIPSLPIDWAKFASKQMGVKVGTIRAYARGERCRKGQHIELLILLTKYKESITKKVEKLTA